MTKQRISFGVLELSPENRIDNNSHFGLVLLFCMVLAITGCSNRKVITTADDSAEYKTARALAPLKKSLNDEPVAIEATVAKEEPPVRVSRQAVSDLKSKQVADDEVVSRTIVSDMPATVGSNDEEVSVADGASVEAALLTEDNGVKLMLSGGIDDAWAYLTEKLEGSEITVFSRNKSAGRIAIGCAEIGIKTEVVRAGRWSIFNRKANRTSEYCSLQAVERKGSTVVSALDRAGQEAPADDSRLIFDRILK